MPGIADMVINGYSAGYGLRKDREAEQRRQGLAGLYQQAYSAPASQRQGLLGQIAGVGGIEAASSTQQALGQFDDRRHAALDRAAQMILAAPEEARPQLWSQIVAGLNAEGITGMKPDYDPVAVPKVAEQIVQAYGGGGQTTEARNFSSMTRGFSPEEIDKARRIQAGLAPRAVTGAMRFDTWTDSAGNPRPQRNNPTTGQVEIYVDEKGAWVPLGEGATAGSPPGQKPTQVNIAGIPQDEQGRISRVTTAMEQAGYSQPDIDAFVLSRLDGQSTAQPGLGVGRKKEDEAARVKAAEYGAQVDALPTIGGLEARNAGQKELAVGAAQTQTAAGVEAAKQFGQDAGKAFTAVQESGRAGAKERARLSLLRADLQKTYTGPGANTLLGIKRVANAFGVKVDGMAEGEAARALSNQLALALRNPAGGEGMPGAMSNSDREFLRQSVPSLENSPQGWRAMVDVRLALADAAVKQAQYAEQLRRQGVPIQDIPGRVQDFANQNPVFQVHDSASSRRALLEKY